MTRYARTTATLIRPQLMAHVFVRGESANLADGALVETNAMHVVVSFGPQSQEFVPVFVKKQNNLREAHLYKRGRVLPGIELKVCVHVKCGTLHPHRDPSAVPQHHICVSLSAQFWICAPSLTVILRSRLDITHDSHASLDRVFEKSPCTSIHPHNHNIHSTWQRSTYTWKTSWSTPVQIPEDAQPQFCAETF